MLKLWIVCVILGCSLVGMAQKDAETKIILEAAAKKVLAYKTVQFKFDFVIENTSDETLDKYSGELWIKGSKFKMNVDQTITICDGKSRWVYLVEANEVNVSTIEIGEDLDPEERFLIDPLSIFTLYKSGFKYITSGTQNINNKEYTIVDLVPEDISKPYFKIKCWISGDNDYYAIKYFQKDGTHITLNLIDLNSDIKIKDSFFVFNTLDYPNVEVIDLRE